VQVAQMQYDDLEVVRQISHGKMVLNHFLQKPNVVQNMKKNKIVWYWNSRLRCFRSKRKNSSTSTGGKGFEVPGRISDSATVAGNMLILSVVLV
jgi:hypothetical protein